MKAEITSRLRSQQVVLFVLLLACTTYFLPRWADWNVNSRFDLVMALVDDHTVSIDRYVSNTGDYAEYAGHRYSDKAPGISLAGVPVYALIESVLPRDISARLRQVGEGDALSATLNKQGSGLQPDKLYVFASLAATTFIVVALSSAALGVLFFNMCGDFGLRDRQRWVATLLYGLATSAFPYANSFVSHQFAAALLFGAFVLIFEIKRGVLHRAWLPLAGLLLGYSVITEYPTALIAGLVGLYALASARRIETIAQLALGALPAVLILGVYDYVTFGTVLPVGYLHSALYQDVHQQGLVGVTHPRLDTLWGITFGSYRGLFFLSPFLLFALNGYLGLWRKAAYRAEFWVLLLAPVSFVLFNSSVGLEQGGFAVGPRYVVPALPFLCIVAALGLAGAWRTTLWRPVIVIASAWSFFAIWAESIGGQSFPDYTANPLFNLSVPKLLSGDIARNLGMGLGLEGWASLLPLALIVVVAHALVWPLLKAQAPGSFQARQTPPVQFTGLNNHPHRTALQKEVEV